MNNHLSFPVPHTHETRETGLAGSTGPMVMLAAAGTGGHIYPALALAEALIRSGFCACLATDRRGLKLVQGSGLAGNLTRVFRIPSSGFGTSRLRRLKSLFFLGIGGMVSMWWIWRSRVAIVVGFGGYGAVAPSLAADLLKCPVLASEANAALGLANRVCVRFARALLLGFPETAKVPVGSPATFAGVPVRRALSEAPPYKPPTAGVPIHLLGLGGSLGASHLSRLLPQAVALLPPEIKDRLQVCQQVRKEDQASVLAMWQANRMDVETAAFFDNVPERLAWAHLVIARAGGSTIFELARSGRPSILVPLPHSAEGHQVANAEQFARADAAELWIEEGGSAKNLAHRLETTLSDVAILQSMSNAAKAFCPFEPSDRFVEEIRLTLDAGNEPSSRFRLRRTPQERADA